MAIPTDLDNAQTTAIQTHAKEGWFARIMRAFRYDPRWWCGVVLLVFVLAAIFAPIISPYSPILYHPSIAEQGPGLAHPLGTDDLGRDQLSRVIYGTRISLSVGIVTILLGGIVGTILGVIGAYRKGWVDQLITIVVDALLSFPSLILALALVAALGPSIINLASILLRHILPNIFSPLLVQATISISLAILEESVLSFLGLGAQPPTPEWGMMINEAQQYLATDPWMMIGPALAIVIVLLSLNILGDAVRDHLDPRDMIGASKPL